MFTLSLLTPEKKLHTDLEIEELIVPAYRGELNVLPGHAPLMTTLSTGVLRYKETGASEFKRAAISWGYCEVNPKGVNVLADTAELEDQVEIDRAEKAYKEAQDRLKSAGLAPDELLKAQRKSDRARARLSLKN